MTKMIQTFKSSTLNVLLRDVHSITKRKVDQQREREGEK